jgi:hypothetical protein
VHSRRAYRCPYRTAGFLVQLPRLLRGTALGTARLTAPRDRDIRWSHEQRKRHLPPILNHAHFPILPRFPSKNPPSMILAGAHEVLPVPWQSARGCRLLLLETLVETRMSLSTCCRRVDNRVRLGQAKGRGKRGPSSIMGSIKDLWIYPWDRRLRDALTR